MIVLSECSVDKCSLSSDTRAPFLTSSLPMRVDDLEDDAFGDFKIVLGA